MCHECRPIMPNGPVLDAPALAFETWESIKPASL
jgi:hypothetical protein